MKYNERRAAMKLEIKTYKKKELAEWFQITPNCLSRTWDKRVKELANYCKFEDLGRKGINILEVYYPEYAGKSKQIVEDNFHEAWQQNPNILRDASERLFEMKKDLVTVTEETLYKYFCEVKREKYGVPRKCRGTEGYCQWVFVAFDENGKPRYLTKEELKIKKRMLKTFFKDADTRMEELNKLHKSYKLGEVTAEEYIEISNEITGMAPNGAWDQFNAAFESKIGCSCGFALELVDTAF